MTGRKNLIVILSVVGLALGMLLISYLGRTKGEAAGTVSIYTDGKLYKTVSMATPQDVRVEQENGCVNIVHIDQNGAKMSYSSCKNQLCVEQGEVTYDNYKLRSMGTNIICLPNKVQIVLDVKDAAAGEVPDI